MNYIPRDLEKTVKSLSKEYSCILLTGPRQVGKSTMLTHLDPKRNVVTLDDLQERNLARNDPEMFLKIHGTPILIGEIQYAPELFSYIKIQIDKGAKPGSFWLTGSQSYKLMSLAEESLAGRIAILKMSGLSQHEIYGKNNLNPFDISLNSIKERMSSMKKGDVNDIYERIWKGSLPGYISKKYSDRDVFYSGYVQKYISRDVRDETNISNENQFLDFIRSAACRVGQVLNTHSMAVDVGISDDTAKRWLDLLEKAGIIFFLHAYSNNLLKRTIKAPKLYFFDTGLVSYLTRYSSPEILQNGSINGAILENYVVVEIIKSFSNCGKEPYIYYYRDKEMNEIDLLIEKDGKINPIEIKRSSNPSETSCKSFYILTKNKISTGTGALICMKDHVSAVDKDNLVIPIWCI